jgi:site-specific DNA-methyltransferase (adenine-specific)
MHTILPDHGSIFVHVDWHASHYVRVLMDEIYGRENFINEIVWCFGGGSSSRRYFHRKHDLIFWYAKSDKYTYNPQYRPYTEGTLQRGLTSVKGSRYKLRDEGALMQDWWIDINKILSPTARENYKFPTQKPKELIKRLIASASKPGSLVADFFAGSGTTAEVCNEMDRNWILCDSSNLALQTSLYRLIKNDSPPFIVKTDKNIFEDDNCGELILKKPVIEEKNNDYLIEIGIDSYRPPNIEKDLIGQDFSIYIEFWEIDLDFNGEIFYSHYQVIRNKHRFKEPIALNFMFRTDSKENLKIAV